MRDFQSREKAQVIAEKLKIYAQAQRLMILSSLVEGEKSLTNVFNVFYQADSKVWWFESKFGQLVQASTFLIVQCLR